MKKILRLSILIIILFLLTAFNIEPEHCFEYICFSYSDQFSTEIIDQIVPADAPDFFLSLPEHIKFEFTDYPIQNHLFETPTLTIIPITDYIELHPDVEEQVNLLINILETKPEKPETLPTLPTWNAAQIMKVQISYLEFNDISGVRFLTQYGQSFWPINNNDMFYYFLGLTSDNEHLITGVFPINHPDIINDGNELYETKNYDEFADGFITYIADTETFLNTQPPKSFFPPFALLDQFINSISIIN